MVERPIKKSERQAHAAPSDVEQVSAPELNSVEGSPDATSLAAKEKITLQPVQRKDKTKGKGSSERQSEQLPVNRALVRGPKPKKSELPIKQSPEITPDDAISESSQPTAAEE